MLHVICKHNFANHCHFLIVELDLCIQHTLDVPPTDSCTQWQWSYTGDWDHKRRSTDRCTFHRAQLEYMASRWEVRSRQMWTPWEGRGSRDWGGPCVCPSVPSSRACPHSRAGGGGSWPGHRWSEDTDLQVRTGGTTSDLWGAGSYFLSKEELVYLLMVGRTCLATLHTHAMSAVVSETPSHMADSPLMWM